MGSPKSCPCYAVCTAGFLTSRKRLTNVSIPLFIGGGIPSPAALAAALLACLSVAGSLLWFYIVAAAVPLLWAVMGRENPRRSSRGLSLS